MKSTRPAGRLAVKKDQVCWRNVHWWRSSAFPVKYLVSQLAHVLGNALAKTVLPNTSLNRTFCGSPGLGFISFSPKPGLPQNAG